MNVGFLCVPPRLGCCVAFEAVVTGALEGSCYLCLGVLSVSREFRCYMDFVILGVPASKKVDFQCFEQRVLHEC